MTEEEWLSTDSVIVVAAALRGGPSVEERKSRLMAIAWTRVHIEGNKSIQQVNQVLRFAERLADGEIPYAEIERRPTSWYPRNHSTLCRAVVNRSGFQAMSDAMRILGLSPYYVTRSADHDPTAYADVGCDICGNPFRPVTLDRRWLSSTVLNLARTIYEEFPRQAGDYMKMHILADALMDAGCDSEEILNHCRGPGPHVRGCHVLDLQLGKS